MTDNRSIGGTAISSEKYESLTAGKTIGKSDLGKTLLVTAGSGVSITVPAEPTTPTAGDSVAAFDPPVGASFDIIQGGAGAVTVAAASGATVHGVTTAKTLGQYARVHVEKVGVNLWYVSGNTALS
jgi:hypothetical protein